MVLSQETLYNDTGRSVYTCRQTHLIRYHVETDNVYMRVRIKKKKKKKISRWESSWLVEQWVPSWNLTLTTIISEIWYLNLRSQKDGLVGWLVDGWLVELVA